MCELSFSLTFSPRALGDQVFFRVTFMTLHYLAITAFWVSLPAKSLTGSSFTLRLTFTLTLKEYFLNIIIRHGSEIGSCIEATAFPLAFSLPFSFSKSSPNETT